MGSGVGSVDRGELIRRARTLLEEHATVRATARLGLDDLGVHGAGEDGGGLRRGLVIPTAGAQRQQLLHGLLQLALAVDQELAGGHDDIAFVQATEHLREVVIRHEPRGDLTSREAPLAHRHEHQLSLTGVDHGLGRHGERVLLTAILDPDRREHARLESHTGVVELEPHPQGAALGVQGGVDVRHLAFDDGALLEAQLHLGWLAQGDPWGVELVDLGLHPDAGQIADAVQVLARLDPGTLHHVLVQHEARRGGPDGDGAGGLTGAGHGVDVPGADVPQLELAASRARQGAVGALAAQREQVLFLGRDQLGGVDLEQALAGSHLVAGLVHEDALHPAVEAQVDDADLVLGHLDLTDGPQVAEDGLGAHHLRAHAHVLDHDRIDGDQPPAAHAHLVLVDRDQVHAHGRLARLVRDVGGIHGGDPVGDDALPVGRRAASTATLSLHGGEVHSTEGAAPGVVLHHLGVHATGPELIGLLGNGGGVLLLRPAAHRGGQEQAAESEEGQGRKRHGQSPAGSSASPVMARTAASWR